MFVSYQIFYLHFFPVETHWSNFCNVRSKKLSQFSWAKLEYKLVAPAGNCTTSSTESLQMEVTRLRRSCAMVPTSLGPFTTRPDLANLFLALYWLILSPMLSVSLVVALVALLSQTWELIRLIARIQFLEYKNPKCSPNPNAGVRILLLDYLFASKYDFIRK